MNTTELLLLERELAVSLPPEYSEALLNDPLQAELPPDYITDFASDKETLVRANQLYRKCGYYNKGWPDNIFWIGGDGGGGAYFLQIHSNDSNVHYIDWEDREHSFDRLTDLTSATSISEFLIQARQRTIDTIIECEGEFNAV